eukprot:TRINITY_DN23897_c0_g1_i1.p1 TRINITY_DN23897_c0_g1~~TRINITY_DN23897_c0_g1_i1.p1  ORF type:complete len:310 (-),score=24.41 TRINITY_DN23897_c0_g1_i1:143-1072(-)
MSAGPGTLASIVSRPGTPQLAGAMVTQTLVQSPPLQHQQVAVVTGGNRGIGFEIARACVSAGFRVVITVRDEGQGEKVAQVLGCEYIYLDLNDERSILACAAEVRARYGQIDVLINNASMAYKHDDPTPWTQKVRTTVTTNFFGTLAVCSAFVPLLRAGARMIIVASSAGRLRLLTSEYFRREFSSADSTLTVPRLVQLMSQFITDVEKAKSTANAPGANWPHVVIGWPNNSYGMSKMAQIALTKVYARELASRGIAVNCCCPGSVATGMNPGGSRTAAEGADTPVWLACQPASAATGFFFRDRALVPW